jgi:hypothetical protein
MVVLPSWFVHELIRMGARGGGYCACRTRARQSEKFTGECFGGIHYATRNRRGQAAADSPPIRLADISIRGNGHFLMLEKNNLDIAAVIADWLDKRVTPNETTAGEKVAR